MNVALIYYVKVKKEISPFEPFDEENLLFNFMIKSSN